jgi:hypothetical protein
VTLAIDIARVILEKRTAVKPCVCGGRLRADLREPAWGVARHNATKRHQAWRLRKEALEERA